MLGLLACVFLTGCEDDLLPPGDSGLPRATYYTVVVRPGDTLSAIAARYDVSADDVADMNGFSDAGRIRTGQVLRIPASGGATRDAVLGEASSTRSRNYAPPPKPINVARYEPSDRVVVRPLPPPAQIKVEPGTHHVDEGMQHSNSDAETAAPEGEANGSAAFVWPVNGQVISQFGASGRGERNDGINIAASEGTPIHAAAAGTITYAGNGIKGYGNLVLIQHDGGYITAYAHADTISVSRGDHVSKGQVIGLAGATGDVDRPQVHFEIRRGVQPINPRLLLAAKN
ncbi:MAG: M23 family metallopeptidase [Rhizomicrobium sp.]|jgi:murein DD-endopeptidase MepM/ murein hydrolase activator NlpD